MSHWMCRGQAQLSLQIAQVSLVQGHCLDHQGSPTTVVFHPIFLLSNGTLSSNKIKHGGGMHHTAPINTWFVHAQLCPTLCDPTDCSLPGSSVHGIIQARILEWVAMPSSKGSSGLRDQTQCLFHLLHWRVGSLPLAPHEKPFALDEAN